MEVEDIKAQDLRAAQTVLHWRDFAHWIGMYEEHETVRGWIRKGYLTAHKIGKHVMVHVALVTHQLMEKEEF
ncbi:DNA-binding protein [Pseudomonas aeruginosa]|uniref:DNA-binding protein n=1 Tax=Pseudomonas aeruginosa TaxID=287 RepID=UPI001C608156|nr:DNA-binding protein [Pseudomonas aeruginosa]MBW5465851.1 DNA-binding protein [Pseudomonas aeruginosa]